MPNIGGMQDNSQIQQFQISRTLAKPGKTAN